MRSVTLRTNLRGRHLRRWQLMAAALWVASFGILTVALGLWHESALRRAKAAGARAAITRITTEVETQEKVGNRYRYDEKLVAWILNVLPSLDLPHGPPLAGVLYELEKIMPDGASLSSFEYSSDGTVEFKATAKSRAGLTEFLTRLQNGRFFHAVQVLSQQASVPEKFEAHVKLKVA